MRVELANVKIIVEIQRDIVEVVFKEPKTQNLRAQIIYAMKCFSVEVIT